MGAPATRAAPTELVIRVFADSVAFDLIVVHLVQSVVFVHAGSRRCWYAFGARTGWDGPGFITQSGQGRVKSRDVLYR